MSAKLNTDSGKLFTTGMINDAVLSPCRRYRYSLLRDWGGNPAVAFIGLNPSTADETKDDPTVRRCVGFAKRWGYRSMYMLNLFAWRATHPKDLANVDEPVGLDNDRIILNVASSCAIIVACWGTQPFALFRQRAEDVVRLVLSCRQLYCLGTTKGGHPLHPLYLHSTKKPEIYLPCQPS